MRIKPRKFIKKDNLLSVPPTTSESRFVVREKTGSVIIRRDFDCPTETFRAGDSI